MNDLKEILEHYGKLKSTQNQGTKLVYIIEEVEFTYFTQSNQCFKGTQEIKNPWTLKEAIRKLQ